MAEYQNELWGDRRLVYRCGGTVQAGTSYIEVPELWTRTNIRNSFFNPSYILSGEGFYIDEAGNKSRYAPGTLLIRFPGILHHQLHEPGQVYVDKFFAIPSAFGTILLEQKMLSLDKPLIELGMRPSLVEDFDSLSSELENCREDFLMPVIAEYFSFFCRLMNLVSSAQPHYAEIMAGAEMLERNLEQNLSASDLAEKIGMSYPNFRRLFTQYLKMPPNEYRIRKRIEKIKHLMLSSDISLKEISERFGYADIYTFSRQFKLYAGIPPAEFRRREICRKL